MHAYFLGHLWSLGLGKAQGWILGAHRAFDGPLFGRKCKSARRSASRRQWRTGVAVAQERPADDPWGLSVPQRDGSCAASPESMRSCISPVGLRTCGTLSRSLSCSCIVSTERPARRDRYPVHISRAVKKEDFS